VHNYYLSLVTALVHKSFIAPLVLFCAVSWAVYILVYQKVKVFKTWFVALRGSAVSNYPTKPVSKIPIKAELWPYQIISLPVSFACVFVRSRLIFFSSVATKMPTEVSLLLCCVFVSCGQKACLVQSACVIYYALTQVE